MPATGALLRHLLANRPPNLVCIQGATPTGPHHRRKRNRRHQLRIVRQPMALIGVCPAVIEDILATGMTAGVEGQPALIQRLMIGAPAALGAHRPATFQCRNKSGLEKRIISQCDST